MNYKIDSSWNPILGSLYQDPLLKLRDEILPDIKFYPEREDIFNVFQMPLKNIKVVILGQDPYFTPETAIGYAFAVNKKHSIPPSLRVIRKEIEQEGLASYSGPENFLDEEWRTLSHWTNQGVFLLNTALTVEAGKAGSHIPYWDTFTKRVIQLISKENPCIWLLWGKKAQEFSLNICKPFIVKGYTEETIKDIPVADYNYILNTYHPAASLYGGSNTSFIGCQHFFLANEILKANKKEKIKW